MHVAMEEAVLEGRLEPGPHLSLEHRPEAHPVACSSTKSSILYPWIRSMVSTRGLVSSQFTAGTRTPPGVWLAETIWPKRSIERASTMKLSSSLNVVAKLDHRDRVFAMRPSAETLSRPRASLSRMRRSDDSIRRSRDAAP